MLQKNSADEQEQEEEQARHPPQDAAGEPLRVGRF